MKRYHGMSKYWQITFFPNVVKDVRPTYGNKEELAPLMIRLQLLWSVPDKCFMCLFPQEV